MTGAPDWPEQAELAAALGAPGAAAPPGLRTWNGSDPTVRLAVHRNTLLASRVAGLADTFPVVRELVGPDYFAAMARAYLVDHPPRHRELARHGVEFAQWVAGFAPVSELPYLADMARLEFARLRAAHAADALPLATEAIAARLHAPESLPGSRLGLHPAVAVVCSAHAVVSLWAAHQGLGRVEDVALGQPECALLLRVADAPHVLLVDPASARFISCLLGATPLAQAATEARVCDAAFDPGQTLALLIRHGAIVAWHSPGDLP